MTTTHWQLWRRTNVRPVVAKSLGITVFLSVSTLTSVSSEGSCLFSLLESFSILRFRCEPQKFARNVRNGGIMRDVPVSFSAVENCRSLVHATKRSGPSFCHMPILEFAISWQMFRTICSWTRKWKNVWSRSVDQKTDQNLAFLTPTLSMLKFRRHFSQFFNKSFLKLWLIFSEDVPNV